MSTEPALFIEIFPILPDAIPPLSAYTIRMDTVDAGQIGGRLAYWLSHELPGDWVWADYHILTDTPVSASRWREVVEKLQTNPLYSKLQDVELDSRWHISPKAQADFVIRAMIRRIEPEMQKVLAQKNIKIKNGMVERDFFLRSWVVAERPAVSFSIRSRVLVDQSLSDLIASQGEETVLGIRVADQTSRLSATVVEVTGKLGDFREDLLALTRRKVMQERLQSAPDDDPIVLLQAGRNEYEYPASVLRPIVRMYKMDDLQRYPIVPSQVDPVLRLSPDLRSQLVRAVSAPLKERGIIDNGFNSRIFPSAFSVLDYAPQIMFGENHSRGYKPSSVGNDFEKFGVYKKHPRFVDQSITMGIINALDEPVSDFVEAMRRVMERSFGFRIELLRERKVRVLSSKNLESAVRVIEAENPDVVLVFFPSQGTDDDATEDADDNYRYLKSLTVGKQIASHMISQPHMHDPRQMAFIIMGIVAKSGNIPFVLTEPMEAVDYVVGFDLVRTQLKKEDRITALARIYQADGAFVGYRIHHVDNLEKDEPIPLIVMQSLFPPEMFASKRVIVHHLGRLDPTQIRLLMRWGEVHQTQFIPIEIFQVQIPRLYYLEGKKVLQPPWGSVFKLNNHEAMVVTSSPAEDLTPSPLHIRLPNGGMTIDQAVNSVLAWMILHYGSPHVHKLPASVQFAQEVIGWLSRGVIKTDQEGTIPFWL